MVALWFTNQYYLTIHFMQETAHVEERDCNGMRKNFTRLRFTDLKNLEANCNYYVQVSNDVQDCRGIHHHCYIITLCIPQCFQVVSQMQARGESRLTTIFIMRWLCPEIVLASWLMRSCTYEKSEISPLNLCIDIEGVLSSFSVLFQILKLIECHPTAASYSVLQFHNTFQCL